MNMKPSNSSVSAADTLTILVCAKGHTATKTISQAGDSINIEGFDAGYRFGVLLREVDGVETLSEHLTALETMPEAFVIRGAPLKHVDPTKSHRRKKSNFQTAPEGKRWILIDVDKLAVPEHLDLVSDPSAVIEHFIARLPAAFHEVSYHYQLSSSAGFSKAGTVSAHVWFWLAAPVPDADLRRWAKTVNRHAGTRLIDPAVFSDVQPHYTAAPIFDGVTNPFLVRSKLVKKSQAAANLQVDYVEDEASSPSSGSFESFDSVGFKNRLAMIGDHDGGDGFHNPIISAIASYVAEHGRDNVDPEKLFQIVRDQVLSADRSQHDNAYVEQMASRDHIMPAIDGALEKYGKRPASRRRSRIVKGVPKPVARAAIPGTEAKKQLSGVLDQIIKEPKA